VDSTNTGSFLRTFSATPYFVGEAATGSGASPLAPTSGFDLTVFGGAGMMSPGGNYLIGASVTMTASENWATSYGTSMRFFTTANGATVSSEKARLWHDGSLQVGGTFSAGLGAGSALFTGKVTLNSTGVAATYTASGRAIQIVSSGMHSNLFLNPHGGSGNIFAHATGGTISSPTALTGGHTILYLAATGWDGTNWKTAASVSVMAASDWTGSAHPARMTFSMSPTTGTISAPTDVMRLWSSGGLVLGLNIMDSDPGMGVLLLEGGLSLRGGANRSLGTATLVAGTVTVNNTRVTANSRIFLSVTTVGGTQGILSVGTVTAGTSFVINSSNAADTSTVAWMIIESAA
jgi:hypothetical protein